MLNHFFQGLIRRLPSQCAVCHAWPAQPVCEACVRAYAQPVPRCATCAIELTTGQSLCGACIVMPPPLDACLSALPYAYPWKELIAHFKFHQQPSWAHTFALLLRSTPWVEPALEAADSIIPMPLSRQRLLDRGYNQSLVLARALDTGKVVHDVLLRVRDTPAQHQLPRQERLRNVQHAFALEPLHAHRLAGKRVVLVDDVMTSGATLFAASRVLRDAGAQHITALVLARTPIGAA